MANKYAVNLIRGFAASLGGLILIALAMSGGGSFSLFSVASGSVAASLDNSAFFYLFVVGPSEETIFRFFVPLIVMVFADTSYPVGGAVGAVLFGLAHYWAYGGSTISMATAIMAGGWQAAAVYFYSIRRNGKFTFSPGLFTVMLGHGMYDFLVITMPGALLYVGAGMIGILALTYMVFKANNNDEDS